MADSTPKRAKVKDFVQYKKAERAHDKLLYDYGERVKELSCLYGFSKLVEKPNASLEDILQMTSDLLPAAWQYPEITCSRIILGKQEFKTENFKQTQWKQQSTVKVHGKRAGAVEVYYLEEKPEIDEGPFLKEERYLLDAIAERLGRIIERKRAEKELQKSEKKLRFLLGEVQRRESDVSALLKASGAILHNREFKVSARAVFDACKELIGATAGYVALLSDDGKYNIVLFLESGGLPCTVDPSLPMPIRGLRAETYLNGKAAIENDFPKCRYKKFLPGGHVHLKNVLFAPLNIDSKTVGTIGLANKPGGFSKHDAEMAIAFGRIASMALVNSNMLEMIEENEKRLKAQSENLENLVEERTKQLRDSERFAAIGTTAAMVGHDIRNPLQSIIGELYLTKSEAASISQVDAKKQLIESVENIEKDIGYINKIVQDLQDFAKPIRASLQETDLKEVVNDVIKKNKIPKNIAVSIRIEENAKKANADPDLLRRVLENLVSNAVQAMPDGGKLSICSHKGVSDTVITVQDSGVGIPEEVKGKLFTPLFTTKSKGQGFGLAVVKRMMEAMWGTVAFESQEGKGTTFTVRLPP